MDPLAAPALLENRCYDELAIGESASLTRTLTQQDIELFAILSGDVNPAHLDEAYAMASPFHKVIAHGMWGGTLISTVLGTRLPGPGTIYVKQTLAFLRPVGLGDVITVTVTVKDKLDKNRVLLDCECSNQLGKPVITGEAEVIAPDTKVRRTATTLPDLQLHHHERFDQLMARIAGLAPARCAIVHPLEAEALRAAMAARDAGILEPWLVGPQDQIRDLATTQGLDTSGARWLDCADRTTAVKLALHLARTGEVEALMQGDVPTLDLLRACMASSEGLRAGRRISHAYIADVPGRDEPLIVTDAALNIQPTLEAKRDIAQNAIDLALRMGLAPRVAVLSAAVDASSQLSSSVDAAALCKMSERGQIEGGAIDGPLPLDAAINPEAARVRHANSPVAGAANVLLVPNLETGDMLVKQLSHLAHADVAGIVLGARVPVILFDATDPPRTRLASAALALLQARQAAATPAPGTASHVT